MNTGTYIDRPVSLFSRVRGFEPRLYRLEEPLQDWRGRSFCFLVVARWSPDDDEFSSFDLWLSDISGADTTNSQAFYKHNNATFEGYADWLARKKGIKLL